MRRLMAGLVLVAVALLPVPVFAFGEPAPYLIKVSGPSRAVDCKSWVRLVATVVGAETGEPVSGQYVAWRIAEGSTRDRLAERQTKTDDRGRASTQLWIGRAAGSRRVNASAAGITGRVAVRVACPGAPLFGLSVSVSCASDPERVTIHNSRQGTIEILRLGSLYRPTADEPFAVYQALPAGASITYRFGGGDGANKLSEDRIFSNTADAEGVRVATSVGTAKKLC